MAKQLTIHQLLDDPVYAKWFTREPIITVVGQSPPWAVYAKKKKKGNWARGYFNTYAQALAWTQKHLDDYYDIVISSRRQAFKPPVVRTGQGAKTFWPEPPGHTWCTYCRRPSHFKYFERHHAFPTKYAGVTPYEKRCTICGMRLLSIQRFSSKLISRFTLPDKKGKK